MYLTPDWKIRLAGRARTLRLNSAIEYILLAAATGFAALLRFFRLGQWSFWGDEIFTVGFKEDGFGSSIWTRSISRDLIHLITARLGASEWSARLLPALVGTITIPVLYFPLKRLFGKQAAWITVILLTVSSWHLYWSQNARFYTSLLLCYTLALLFFLIGMEQDRPWFFMLSLLFLALAAKERLIALFLVPVVISYVILLAVLPFERPTGLRWRNLLLFFSPLFLFGLGLAAHFLPYIQQWTAGFSYPNNTPLWLLSAVFYYLGLDVVILGAFGAALLLIQKSRPGLLLALGAAIPLLGILFLSPFFSTGNRYVFISLVSWIALAGLFAQELFHQLKGRFKILSVGVIALLVFASASEDLFYFQYQKGNRPDWKAAFEYIQNNQKTGDRVVTSDLDLADFYLHAKVQYITEFSISSVQAGERVWFVKDNYINDVLPTWSQWIDQNAKQVANFDVSLRARTYKMEVYLYGSRVISGGNP